AAVSRRWGWDEIVCAVVAIGKSGPDVTEHSHYDFIIIGGGPAGQGAAEFATLAGLRTLVIERNILGGLVVTTGGAPTKTLREAALYLTGFRERALYGLTAPADIALAVERMRARTAQVAASLFPSSTRSAFPSRWFKQGTACCAKWIAKCRSCCVTCLRTSESIFSSVNAYALHSESTTN